MIHKVTDHLQKHRAYDIGLLVLVTLAATSNWFNPGIPKGHDTIGEMLSAQAASNSIFLHHMLPGWTGDWLLGYPQFCVFPPLPVCLILSFSFPFGWVLGTKLLYLSFFVLSGVFAYLYVYELTKNRYASFVAGLAYVFLPYHIIDVGFEGHQGAFGLPYVLIPLILLCLERSIKNPGIKYVLINGVLLALLTLTFPQVFPLLVGPFLVLYVILRIWWERQRGGEYLRSITVTSAAAFCLSLLLTAFWWLPLISEIRYSYATSFPANEAGNYSASFLQAVTLRPGLCCALSSAYGSAGSVFLEILRILPFPMVLLGIILNRRNKYVWFFLASILIAVPLVMGPHLTIDVFGLAYRYVPLFTRLRTPVRFLLFTSFAYAVLIGFCVQSITERLQHMQLRKLRPLGIPFFVPMLVSLIIVGNTWQETRTAFSTFTLPPDQGNALAWLAEKEDGDYRIADPPFDAYVYDAKAGYIIRPTFWTYLHGKETLYGPGLSLAVKYTASALESLNTDIKKGPFDLSQWLSIFNVKYVLFDKTNRLSSNVILDSNFERVWSSETIDIYQNHSLKPRVFSFSNTNERAIDLHNGDTINLSCAEGTQEAVLSLSDEYHLSDETSVKSSYHLVTPADYLCLETNVEGISFHQNDAIHLVFYSQYNLPDMHLTLSLLESDGSRYDVVLDAVDGIKAGWNEVNSPVSLLILRDSPDQNSRLDLDQINRLRIGVAREDGSNQAGEFPLYFDELSVVTQEIDTSVEYTKIRPGKYKVHVNLDSPSYLVLSESYHPNWVARLNGEAIQSQMMYECLNSFYLERGEYDVTLEFTTSPLRIAGNVITGTSIAILCIIGVFLPIRSRRDRRAARNNPHKAEAPPEPQT
ncbi:MAG: hypothetical protein NTZ04_03685 [Chloroflexi bacterium]|nr:hypothetical protein [Chloroflexota bacterium]